VTPNTQAILLLTAPLLVGRRQEAPKLLSLGEYNEVARALRAVSRQPADLLAHDATKLLELCSRIVDPERLERLLTRGFQLAQALERWQTRGIWVLSRADTGYPRRLKGRLRELAPPILYGCGWPGFLDQGGCAIVGSRDAPEGVIQQTEKLGALAARTGTSVISGGARGIDQAALRGAIEVGGRGVAVLADRLERVALAPEHRGALVEQRLALVSPYDPAAGFHAGHAMQRNKLIFGLADAGIVMNVAVGSGGTWAGAIEQLDHFQFVPLFVPFRVPDDPGLAALRHRGAHLWSDFDELPRIDDSWFGRPSWVPEVQTEIPFGVAEPSAPERYEVGAARAPEQDPDLRGQILGLFAEPAIEYSAAEVAQLVAIPKHRAERCLRELARAGAIARRERPIRYRSSALGQEQLRLVGDPA
jgi:DNA processing protein